LMQLTTGWKTSQEIGLSEFSQICWYALADMTMLPLIATQ
jgi:hypothetical protein